MDQVIPVLAVLFVVFWALVPIVIAGYALHLSIKTQIEVGAMKGSTHSIQYVPVDDELPGKKGKPDDDELLEHELERGLARAEEALGEEVSSPMN